MAYSLIREEYIQEHLQRLSGEFLINAVIEFCNGNVKADDIIKVMSLIEDFKSKDEPLASYTMSGYEYQGLQRIYEDESDEHIPCSFSSGEGVWYCFRFGKGDRDYQIGVWEDG